MKKTLSTFCLTCMSALTFAGGEQPQGLVHRHVPSLYTLAAANLPPLEEVAQARPTLPISIILPAYVHKKIVTEKPAPWESLTFNNSEHFWYTIRKTPHNEFPGLECILENEECSRSFLKHAQTPDNNALVAAAYWGRIDEVKKHLEAGADIHFEDDVALGLAAMQGHTSCVAFLLGRGANIHAYRENALRQAIQGGNQETALFLLEQGADRTFGGDEINALYYAAKEGLTPVVLHLINLETNQQEARNTALITAAEYGQEETVATLVEQHADIHYKENTPFRRACENGCAKVVAFLLSQGELPDNEKNQALIDTARGSKEINDSSEYRATLEVLLNSGADIHAYNDRAVRYAIEYGDDAIIDFLLANGASKQAAGEAELQRERRLLRELEAENSAAYKRSRRS